MPPLQLFGYSMFFAGDDLYLLSLMGIVLRFIQIGILIPCFIFIMNAIRYNDSFYDDYVMLQSDQMNSNNNFLSNQNNQHLLDDSSSSVSSLARRNNPTNATTISWEHDDNEIQLSEARLLIVFCLSLVTAIVAIPIDIIM
jgi:hypothetical protein